MGKITLIQPQKKRQHRFSVFIDEEFAMGVSEEALKKFRLRVGMEIETETLKALALEEDRLQARDYVIRLLSQRAYCIQQIRNKLKTRQYDESIIESIITLFIQRGYLDDQKYAREFVASRLQNRPRGIPLLKQELKRKGIPDSIIREILSPLEKDIDQMALAEAALSRRKDYAGEKDPQRRRNKIYRFLAQKGFPPEVIYGLLRRKCGSRFNESVSSDEE